VIHLSCFADAALGLNPQTTGKQVADKKARELPCMSVSRNPSTKFLTYTYPGPVEIYENWTGNSNIDRNLVLGIFFTSFV
jgi:hypothetical protein